jgi:hypothetical protein
MTEPTLFREEAIAFRTRQRGPGAVLRAAIPWVRWLYWVVLALLVAGLALAFFARTDESASGPALVNAPERTFVAVLPAIAGSELAPDRTLRIEVEGVPGRHGVAGEVFSAEAASEADIRRAGFDAFPQPAILVTGALTPDAQEAMGPSSSPRLSGRAVVVLRSERVLTVLFRGFGGVLGGGSA